MSFSVTGTWAGATSGKAVYYSVNGGSAVLSTATGAGGAFTISSITAAAGAVVGIFIPVSSTIINYGTIFLSTGSNVTSFKVPALGLGLFHTSQGDPTGGNINTAATAAGISLNGLFTSSSSTQLSCVLGLTVYSGCTFPTAVSTTFNGNGAISAASAMGNVTIAGITVTLSAGLTITSGDTLQINSGKTLSALGNGLTLTGATFTNSGNLTLQGAETLTGFTNDTANGGTITYIGTGSTSYTGLIAGNNYSKLTFTGSGRTWTLTAGLTVSGTLTRTLGTLKDGGHTINLAGNFVDTAGAGSYSFTGTLNLNGTSQTVTPSGTTVFNLTKTVAAADTLTFTDGTTLTVSNAVTLQGAAGQLLTLAGSSTGGWTIGMPATQTLAYLSVSHSTATGNTAAAGSTSTSGGNNNFWTFGGVAYDNVSNSGYQAATSSLSWSHTWNTWTAGGAMLSIDVHLLSVNDTVTALTYGGATCTFIGAQNVVGGTGRVECWRICQGDSGAPASGSNTVSVTISGSLACAGTAVSYTGVNQSTPTEAFNGNSGINAGSATNATVVVTTVTNNDWVHAAIATNATAITASQTARNNVTGTLGSGADSDTGPISPSAQTMTYTGEGITSAWAIAGYGIVPVGGGGNVYNVSVTETASATDSPSSSVVLGGTVTEAVSASDTPTDSVILSTSVTEAATATDSPTAADTDTSTVTETANALDFPDAMVTPGSKQGPVFGPGIDQRRRTKKEKGRRLLAQQKKNDIDVAVAYLLLKE